jgi:multiple sugar transport system substrate-binding protein
MSRGRTVNHARNGKNNGVKARDKEEELLMFDMITRRSLLGAAGAGAVLAALPARLRAQDVANLNFVVWNYSLDTVQDNVAKFEAAHSGVKVAVTDYTWPDYFDTMMLRFRGNTPTHVMYCGEDWLPGWALAGWLVPLEEHFPQIAS